MRVADKGAMQNCMENFTLKRSGKSDIIEKEKPDICRFSVISV